MTPSTKQEAERERQELERYLEIACIERRMWQERYEFVFKVLSHIHALAPNGNDIRLPDGRVFRFVDPNANETLRALGKAIYAIPDELRAARAAQPAAVPVNAVQWLRDKAEQQKRTNAECPEHAKAYPSWVMRVSWLYSLADELSCATPSEPVSDIPAQTGIAHGAPENDYKTGFADGLQAAISAVPGGSICDPQQVADAIRAVQGAPVSWQGVLGITNNGDAK